MSKKKKREFHQRVPLPVRGGIKAQAYRTQNSRKWWTRRWLKMMEDLRLGARLGRGRGYAFSGQVADLTVSPGLITAVVQGGSRQPYKCEIREEVMPLETRNLIKERLCAKPMLISQLLIRNLPEEIDTAFQAVGYPLIPSEIYPLLTKCSCPDYANPCKHIAAVYYLIAEAIENDPLILLEFRGISREFLTDCPITDVDESPDIMTGVSNIRGNSFWDAELPPSISFGSAPERNCTSPFIRRLGSIPFWRGEEKFLETMCHCGERISAVSNISH